MRRELPTFESFELNEREAQDLLLWLEMGIWSKDIPNIIADLERDNAEYYVTTSGVLVKDFKSVTTDPNKYKSPNSTILEGNYNVTSTTIKDKVSISRYSINTMDLAKVKSLAKKAVDQLNRKYPDYIPDLMLGDVTIETEYERGDSSKSVSAVLSVTFTQLGKDDRGATVQFGLYRAEFVSELSKLLK